MDTRKVQTEAYRPQSNGRLERYHKTLMTTLSMYVSANQRDWDLYIQLCTFAFRVSRHESTGETPAYLVMGRDLPLPMDWSLQLPNPTNVVDVDDYKLDLMFRLQSAWKIAHECIGKAQQKQKNFYDKRIRLPPNYQPGDIVFLYVPAVPKGYTAKLMHLWRAYRVLECRYPNLLVAPCNNPRAKPKLVNIDQVKPGPPDNRTALSLPSLRLPEVAETDIQDSSSMPLDTAEQLPSNSKTNDSHPDSDNLKDIGKTEASCKYKLRPWPHRVTASISELQLQPNT